MNMRQTSFLALFLVLLVLIVVVVVVIYLMPVARCIHKRFCCRGKKTRKSRVRFDVINEEEDHGETILLNVIKTRKQIEPTLPVPPELPYAVRREPPGHLNPANTPPRTMCNNVKPVKFDCTDQNQSLSIRESFRYFDMNRRHGNEHRFCGGENGYITAVDPPTPPHLLLDSPRNSVRAPNKTAKVGRCLPFRRSEAADDQSRALSTTLGALSDSSWKTYATIPRGPTMRRQWGSSSSKLNLPRSCEDLFKGAWWRSTDSLANTHILEDDPKLKRRITPNIRCSDSSSVYMEMRLCKTSRDSCPAFAPWGSNGEGGIRRCSTMPDVFVGHGLSYLTVWCPSHFSENVHFSAEICPPPKPCSRPEYVNVQRSPSMHII